MKKLTTDDFINKAILIHGGKYCYDKSIYLDSKHNIQIFCNKCKIYFWQNPSNHLSGKGCRSCKNKKLRQDRAKTIDCFVLEANIIHNNQYCYDLVLYKNTNTKVKIIHKECGNIFTQTPHNHLAGNGCPKCFRGCFGNRSKREQEWIQSLNEFNGDYWHGNPNKFKSESLNILAKKTFGELYQKTIEKEKVYKSAGYNLVSVWEGDIYGS